MSSAVAAGSTAPSPSSIDPRQLQGATPDYAQSLHHGPIDANYLSSYPAYQQYSNSSNPSSLNTPAHHTPENSVYGEFSDYGVDEFFGVDFDAAGPDLLSDPEVMDDIVTPASQLDVAGSYPQPSNDRTEALDISPPTSHPMTPNLSSSSRESPHPRQPPAVQTYMARVSGPSDGLNSASSPSTMSLNPSLNTTDQPTPTTSQTSADGVTSSMNALPGHSPRVTLTTWNSTVERDLSVESEYRSTIDMRSQQGPDYLGQQDTPSSSTCDIHMTVTQSSNGSWEDDGASGRSGVDPLRRKSISDVEIPNLKDLAKKEESDAKRRDVEEWRSQAGYSTDADDEGSSRSYAMLSAASPNRGRSRSTGAVPSQQNSPQGFSGRSAENARICTPGPGDGSSEGEGIRPVSPTLTIRENKTVEGQMYFNETAANITPDDIVRMQHSRHWTDPAAYPHITNPTIDGKGPTANEMIEKWNTAADSFSLLSRSATWGTTRRRSEPSLVDIESLRSGSLLKRLSFGKGGEKKPSIFNSLNNAVGNIVRKKSVGESSKLKRNRNISVDRGRPPALPAGRKETPSTLAPPARSPSGHRSRPQSPRLNTNFGNELTPGPGHSRRASLGVSSPKAAIGEFIHGVMRRSRSKSELGGQIGLAGQWRNLGGPPVPNLPSPKVDGEDDNSNCDLQLHGISDAEGDDEDDDDLGDDGDLQFDRDTPIVATMDGFRDHVLKLNSMMEPGFLVDRLAHQQMIRYKALLGLRVKHSGALNDGECDSAEFCLSMGGSTKYHEAKAKGRNAKSLHVDGDGSDSNPENQLGAESFPEGVPKPPAHSLPAEFECQLCFKVKKFQKPSDWTKHVHEDVQPFTCTYPNCKEPKSFKRKADWVRHENEKHRQLEWWTCEVDDCSHKCYRKDNFLQHLVREHKLQEPRTKSKAAIKKAKGQDEEEAWRIVRECHHETSAKPNEEPCKFCGRTFTTWKKLTVHLGKHMEQISLPVLRVVEQRPVDANTIISPIEALPTRHAPVTPIGMNRQVSAGSSANYHSNNISPNVQQFPQFTASMGQMGIPPAPSMDDFGDTMYGPPFDYNANASADFGYGANAPMRQQGGMIPRGAPNGFDSLGQMDHSPLLDQSGGFRAMGQPYAGQQQAYGSIPGSYASSNDNLSPSPPGYPPATQGFLSFNSVPTSQQQPPMTSSEAFLAAPQAVLDYQGGCPEQFGLGGYGGMAGIGPDMGFGRGRMEIRGGRGTPYSPSPSGGQLQQQQQQRGFGNGGLVVNGGVGMGRDRSGSGGRGGVAGGGQQQGAYQAQYGYGGV